MSSDLEAHLQAMRTWPEGTPIRVFEIRKKDGTRRVSKARWLGIGPPTYRAKLTANTERLRYALPRGVTCELPLSEGARVQIDTSASAGTTTSARLTISSLVSAVVGDSASPCYVTDNRCDVITVGTATLLETELLAEIFAGPTGDSRGPLQELARVHGIRAGGGGRRSQLVASASEVKSDVKAMEPRVVIYDGGSAFLRHRGLWPEAHALVLFDRAAPSTEEASYELNDLAAYSDSDADVLGGIKPPACVEMFAIRNES